MIFQRFPLLFILSGLDMIPITVSDVGVIWCFCAHVSRLCWNQLIVGDKSLYNLSLLIVLGIFEQHSIADRTKFYVVSLVYLQFNLIPVDYRHFESRRLLTDFVRGLFRMSSPIGKVTIIWRFLESFALFIVFSCE